MNKSFAGQVLLLVSVIIRISRGYTIMYRYKDIFLTVESGVRVGKEIVDSYAILQTDGKRVFL